MRHVPEFDGLRALAVVAVVLFHAEPGGPLRGGFIGVDLFFVLSAFLITGILAGGQSVGRFYWHRATRLLPALLLMLAGYLAVAPFIWPGYNHARDALFALYLADYSYPLARVPLYLQHTWSLAVEEQFYFLWPFIVPLLMKSKRPAAWLGTAFVAMTIWRFAQPDWQDAYYRFDTHATGLILGAALFFRQPKLSTLSGYAALFALAILMGTAVIDASWLAITLAEICSAVLICAPPKWLAAAPFVWLGRRSYAVYLWHFPIAYSLRLQHGFFATSAITLAASGAAAGVSYITVERFGRRLREIQAPWSVGPTIVAHAGSAGDRDAETGRAG